MSISLHQQKTKCITWLCEKTLKFSERCSKMDVSFVKWAKNKQLKKYDYENFSSFRNDVPRSNDLDCTSDYLRHRE